MTPLGTFERAAALERLSATEFDVLVIGGGITGAGVALDAASRGLRTALVERHDFASGTSSKSSKLVHGGLRYLQQKEFGLVYEALAERQRLRRNAPHLVRVLPFLIPLFGKNGVVNKSVAKVYSTALWLYDLTGGLRIGKRHRRITADEALRYMPTLPRDRLVAAFLYYDAQADDARLTLTLARTAALDHGAVVVNHAPVVEIRKDAAGNACGAVVDADGQRIEVRARTVVNAAGVWADELRTLDEGTDPQAIRPAKGIHITVPWAKVRNEIAAVVPVPKDKRSIFVVRWGDRTYVGTTDTDYDGPIDDPQCTAADVRYLLDAINFSLSEPLTEADILGTWAGLRPLVADASSDRTADLSRRHKIAVSPSGIISITGGKLTTYRKMAADTVDAVVRSLGRHPRRQLASHTATLALRGAAGWDTVPPTGSLTVPLAGSPDGDGDGSAAALLAHLRDRYGGEARTVLALIDADATLGEPLVPTLPYLKAEAVYAVRHEMARTLADVLDRRTRARLLARDATAAAAESVAHLIAADLGWSAADVDREVASYRAALAAERAAADLPETALTGA